MNTKVKFLIIGAGISGLTFANYVNDDYLVVEKENEAGGYCRTIKRGGFVWDYAGHFFHFSRTEFKKKFLDSMEDEEIIYKEKNTKIWYKDRLIDYPFQSNIHQLGKEEFIDCLYDLFHRKEKSEYDNFLDMLYGKFGKAIVEKFLRPYNEKLYAVDLEELDKDAMGRFFPYADIPAIIDNMKANKDHPSYNSTFLYPRGGAGSFIHELYDSLDRKRILLRREVTEIDRDSRTAYLNDGNTITYQYLINTSPLNEFLTCFRKKDFRKLEQSLSYNKVLVFNLGFSKKSRYTREHWLYVPDRDINFYRVGFYDNILDSDKLSMYVEIGFEKNEIINVDEQLGLTLYHLERTGIIDQDMELEDYCPIIMNPAYVHINSETDKEINTLKKTLAFTGIYTIGRYGGWTYYSMEDCMEESKNLAEILSNE